MKIQLKSARRKTLVSRNAVRKAVTALFTPKNDNASGKAAIKKKAAKKSLKSAA